MVSLRFKNGEIQAILSIEQAVHYKPQKDPPLIRTSHQETYYPENCNQTPVDTMINRTYNRTMCM